MTYFKKRLSHKWTLSILIVFFGIASCRKETNHIDTTTSEKLSSANDVGLPPGFIGWGREPNVPITDQSGKLITVCCAFAFTINGKGYIGGGFGDASQPKQTWQYDTLTRSWLRVADYPGGNDVSAVTFVIGNNAYVCTGGLAGSNEIWQYNQLTNVWIGKKHFPGGTRLGAVAIAANGKGYVGLGTNYEWTNTTLKLVDTRDWWEYDPITDDWTRKTDFPGTKRNYASAFAINTKGYVTTGHHYNANTSTDVYYNDLWQYDTKTDSWLQKADLPAQGRWQAVGVAAFTNKGVVAGGRADQVSLGSNDCWEYIPSSDSWVQLPNVGGGPRAEAAAFAIGNTLYIGTSGSQQWFNDFWGLTINP
jgi:N-acetylneuraminic acid mutarotase